MRCGAGGVPLAWRHRKFNPDFGQQRGLGGSYKGPSGGPQLNADCAGNMVQVAADLMTIFKITVIQIIVLATPPQIRDSKRHSGRVLITLGRHCRIRRAAARPVVYQLSGVHLTGDEGPPLH
jgi:hypothetical protein